ncbi:DUF4241 domain-containing protein [Streptomyces sp. VRA16 Mangrove soil]|uniref:DUF4241 domain-containing protein n=1 Tax=Streptomyces sp. VRA16 Mangrove soil TaxID=2817434 RepID=UPI001A9DEE9A|nr:DUF4241 domain-containing protein [Streptomyces sp. VRA16 Mangrove soil]MBO1335883.1 DUF4241 domain-containing protein [Streptomyces sp. VRA16 Mangrove soil]
MPMPARDYARYFTPGHTFTLETGQVGTVDVRVAGELWLPSGHVVAGDPFIALGSGECEPFSVAVEPGRYRVDAAVATLVTPGEPPADRPHERVAAARLVIRDEPVATWEHALQTGQEATDLADDEYFGYGVDAGTGCFYDAESDAAFPECEGDEGPLWDVFEKHDHAPGPYLVTSPSTGHTVAAFGSGWGDGAYPTWIGRTAAGEVACFVTDFFVIEDPATV